jgi:hypothetical protein
MMPITHMMATLVFTSPWARIVLTVSLLDEVSHLGAWSLINTPEKEQEIDTVHVAGLVLEEE